MGVRGQEREDEGAMGTQGRGRDREGGKVRARARVGGEGEGEGAMGRRGHVHEEKINQHVS